MSAKRMKLIQVLVGLGLYNAMNATAFVASLNSQEVNELHDALEVDIKRGDRVAAATMSISTDTPDPFAPDDDHSHVFG